MSSLVILLALAAAADDGAQTRVLVSSIDVVGVDAAQAPSLIARVREELVALGAELREPPAGEELEHDCLRNAECRRQAATRFEVDALLDVQLFRAGAELEVTARVYDARRDLAQVLERTLSRADEEAGVALLDVSLKGALGLSPAPVAVEEGVMSAPPAVAPEATTAGGPSFGLTVGAVLAAGGLAVVVAAGLGALGAAVTLETPTAPGGDKEVATFVAPLGAAATVAGGVAALVGVALLYLGWPPPEQSPRPA